MTLGAEIGPWIAGGAREVEAAIFGTDDADAIARAVDDLCMATLGLRIRAYRFYRSSIASVHGVELEDGRRVVIKTHQPTVSIEHLGSVVTIQRRLADGGFPCARPLTEPARFLRGAVVFEDFLTCGAWHDGHRSAFRDALAASLAELIDRCRSVGVPPALQVDQMLAPARRGLWPIPHSSSFDFDATRAGAEAIDAVAAAALRVVGEADTSDRVIGHIDWRAENVRFDGVTICAVYDMESLRATVEPVNVGGASFVFASDWHHAPNGRQAASIDEARAFVSAYETARGAPFTTADRRVAAATAAYGAAYVARCAHAADPAGRREEGEGFRNLVREHGLSLLRIFDD